MRVPVMQQEWQRRQTQRSVWVLLSLLAVLSCPAATTAPAVLPVQPPHAAEAVRLDAADQPSDRLAASCRSDACAAYWQELAPEADRSARLQLSNHAAARPVASSQDVYLRRFIRPPTA